MNTIPQAEASDGIAELKELRELAALHNFDLFIFLSKLTELGADGGILKIDDLSAEGTGNVVVNYQLSNGLKALLLTFRAMDSDTHKIKGSASDGRTFAAQSNAP
jgi:hypothetical protein